MHAGNRIDLDMELIQEGRDALPIRIAHAGQRHAQSHSIFGHEAGIDVQDVREGTQQEARAHEEDQGDRHLAHHEEAL